MSHRRQLFASNNGSTGSQGGVGGPAAHLPEFNIAILGTLGVGKSAFTVKFITKRFIMEYDPEIEDVYTKVETIDGQDVRVTIMDTCDTDRKSPDRYLKWAQAFIVIYSITSRPSFDDARTYLETITQYQRITGKDLPVALVGNKMDLDRYRTVSRLLGEEEALHFECSFYETSAADDYESVEAVFVDVVREVARINDRQMPLQSLFISEDRSASANSSSGGTGYAYRRPRNITRPTSSTPSVGGTTSDSAKKDSSDAKILTGGGRKTSAGFKFFPFKIFN